MIPNFENDKVICPNCGSITQLDNYEYDYCKFCGGWFNIEWESIMVTVAKK